MQPVIDYYDELASRRRIGRRFASGWHGDTAVSIALFALWAGPDWQFPAGRACFYSQSVAFLDGPTLVAGA